MFPALMGAVPALASAPNPQQARPPIVPVPTATLTQLPRFIKTPFVKKKIDAEDAQFLARKGAFTLPSEEVQQALLVAFVEWVYPFMPMLELHPFLRAINSRDGSAGQVSLFLYQAVMFVAVAFLDEDVLALAGFPNNRLGARRAFYERARVCFFLSFFRLFPPFSSGPVTAVRPGTTR